MKKEMKMNMKEKESIKEKNPLPAFLPVQHMWLSRPRFLTGALWTALLVALVAVLMLVGRLPAPTTANSVCFFSLFFHCHTTYPSPFPCLQRNELGVAHTG